jgi:hypothetical protein
LRLSARWPVMNKNQKITAWVFIAICIMSLFVSYFIDGRSQEIYRIPISAVICGLIAYLLRDKKDK